MCGIAGIVARTARPVEQADLSKMLEKILHRGPDACGTAHRGPIALGARRLAIVDVANGTQPVWSESGRIVAVVNGEIFNHSRLRADLKARGYRFQTNCDAELVPALYAAHGPDFVKLLNGQFAIALYDFDVQKFFAWRDPFGICPLFYSTTTDELIFASEIKGILAHRSMRPELDSTGLDQILTFPGPISPRTLFKGIASLPPGGRLEVKAGGEPKVTLYWDMEFVVGDEGRSEESWAEELEALLLEAVRLRRADEVPTALYLSGGLDSSVVGSMLSHLSKNDPIDAFSVVFADNLISEAKHQETMRKALKARGHVIEMDTQSVWRNLEAAVWHTETPLRETFNTASLALSTAARHQGYKVVLAGQGADELFAGYVGYRFDARAGARRPTGSTADAELNESLWGDRDFSYERQYCAFAEHKKRLYSPRLRARFDEFDCTKSIVLPARPGAGSSKLQRRSYVDCKLRLSDHLLSGHGDRMAMANSVEVRYPFLDKEVVDFACRTPDTLKLKALKEKYVVKAASARWVPSEIINREKFGFTAPGSPALLALSNERIEDLTSDARIRRQNVFDADEVRRLKERYRTPGFRLAVPFETDLLITVITYGIFSDLFGLPDL